MLSRADVLEDAGDVSLRVDQESGAKNAFVGFPHELPGAPDLVQIADAVVFIGQQREG